MKDQILKIAKVKSEKEFYKKYPTEAAFMKAHGKAFKKAAMGAKMVETQLDQLTDFGNPPMAQVGTMIGGNNLNPKLKPVGFNDLMTGAKATNAGISKEEQMRQDNLAALEAKNAPDQEVDGGFAKTLAGVAGQFLGEGGDGDVGDIVNDLPIHRYGGDLYKYQGGGGLTSLGNSIGSAFQGQGGLGSGLVDMFSGTKGTGKGLIDASQAMFKGVGLKGGLKTLGTSAGLKTAGKAAGVGILNAAPQILQGIGQIKEQKQAIKQADQTAQISNVTALAAESQPQLQKRRYARPEDSLVQPGQLGNPQGAGTNFLAQNGRSIGGNPTEIQNTYSNPLDIYSDLGFTPLNDNIVKQYQVGGKVKFDPSTYKRRPDAESSDIKSSSNLLLSAGAGGANSNDFSNYSTTINKYANMGNDTSYMSTRNTPAGIEEFFHNTNQGNPISQLRRGKEFINLSPDQVNAYKQKVLTGTGGFEQGGNLPTAEFGDYFQDSGQASIGKGVGTAVGSIFGPIGGMIGGALGGVAGNLLGGAKDANQLANFQDTTKKNTERAAWAQGAQNIQSTYSSFMEDGGWVSNDWQPQTITKFGEYNMNQLLAPPNDADMLRAGGHLKEYTPPSAEAMFTDRAQYGKWVKRTNDPGVEVAPTGGAMANPRLSDIKAYTQMNATDTNRNGRSNYNQDFTSAQYTKDYYDNQPSQEVYSYGRDNGNKFSEFIRMATEGQPAVNELHRTEERRPFLNLIGKKQIMDRYDMLNEKKAQGYMQQMNNAMPGGLPGYTAPNMEYGGQLAMGGDLQVHRGTAETMSYNPYLPGDGETVMFRGPSHDNGGIPVSYGQNGVEVEGGEPAIKLQDGGQEENLVVFGNMVIPKYGVAEIGDDKAKGKKFKNYIADLSRTEAKQNKIIDKSTKLVNSIKNDNPFDQLTMNASRANLLGANMKLKDIADKKQRAAVVQNAILDTAKEFGVESDGLAKGKIKAIKDPLIGKNGLKLKKAQSGDKVVTWHPDWDDVYNNDAPDVLNAADIEMIKRGMSKPGFMGEGATDLQEVVVTAKRPKLKGPLDIIPMETNLRKLPLPPVTFSGKPLDLQMAKGKKKKGKFDWEMLAKTLASGLGDYFRPSTNNPLDGSQLMGEMYALGNNQQDPVYAQTYQPMLDNVYDISLQDQINSIDSQARAAIRAAGDNPSAQAYIMSQAAELKNKTLGEQMRINQANRAQVFQGNRAAINDSVLKNIGILDNQQVRQSTAKSRTKEQAIEALNSISDKIARNKLETRNINTMENLYGYRFGQNDRVYNANNPYFFNSPIVGSMNVGGLSEYEKAKAITNAYEKKTKGLGKEESRNGSIVKALKNI